MPFESLSDHAANLVSATRGFSLLCLLLLILLSVITDLRRHKIPNLFTFSGLTIGIFLQIWAFGLDGLVIAFTGVLAGFLILIPFYITGGTAAGDVKLLMAVGSLLGPFATIVAGLATLIFGGLLGLAIMLARGGLVDMLWRYGRAFKLFFRTTRLGLEPPAPGSTATQRFPYAVAIAAGTVLAAYDFNLFSIAATDLSFLL